MKLKIFGFQLIIPFCTYRYIGHVHSQNQMLLHIYTYKEDIKWGRF